MNEPDGEGSTTADSEDPRALIGSPTYRRALIALFFAGVTAFVQLYSPQGLLPDLADAFGLSAGTSSWAVGAATIGVAAGVLPWAVLSDRIGRVRAMRWAVIAGVVAGLLLPLAPTFGAIVVVRFIEGLALAGIPALAVTTLAETVSPRVLGAAVGTFIAGNTIGGLSGRIIAATVADLWGWRMGLLTVSVVAALAAVAFMLVVPATKVRPAPVPMLRGVLANLKNPGVLVSVCQAFLLMGAFVSAYNYLTFRLQQAPFYLSLAEVSLIFLAYLAGAVASKQVWKLAPRLTPTGALLASIGVMLVGVALTLLPSLIAVVGGLILLTGGFFGAHTIASTLGPRRSQVAQSMVPPLYNLGFYSGSSLLGWVGGLAFAAAGWPGTVGFIAVMGLFAATLAYGYALRNGGLRAVDG